MPQENVELVRSLYAAWDRGDFSSGSGKWAHPEIEFMFADEGDREVWTGRAGMAEGLRGWLSAWDEFRVEAEGFRELDDDRVLVLTKLSGRGKTSGVELGQMSAKGADLFHVRDGKVIRLVLYPNRNRALAELGLEE